MAKECVKESLGVKEGSPCYVFEWLYFNNIFIILVILVVKMYGNMSARSQQVSHFA